ncbi:MAG: Dabb family protein [Microscillaceae bacterium]|nr:Dabb family protein [Microscillaceae bacterium]
MILRRSFLTKLGQAFTLLGLGAVASKTYAASEEDKTSSEFYHVVYFWMKNPDNAAEQESFLKSIRPFLAACEKDKLFTRKPYLGKPAGTPRDVVDNSYTYNLVCTFKSATEQNVYQEHAAHKKFVADSSTLWTKVQVYDSITLV